MTAAAKGMAETIDRYEITAEIASGGMATVHLGRLLGRVGFARTVAIKRLHRQYAKNPEFVAMFLDEARLAARIRHPNVIPTLDVVAAAGEVLLVMEYIEGESLAPILSNIAAREERIDPRIAVSLAIGMLEGLHAAHEATNEVGSPLDIVHRDVSPHNVLVGADGAARVFDFGIAKAADRIHTTQDGSVRGKIAYMSPEQLSNALVDRRTDIWAASVVLWELLASKRLFVADSQMGLIHLVMTKDAAPPSSFGCPASLDAVLARGLARDLDERFASAHEMAVALEAAVSPASPREVSVWLERVAADSLRERRELIERLDREAVEDRPSGETRAEFNRLLAEAGGPNADDLPLAASETSTRHADAGPSSRASGRMIVIAIFVAIAALGALLTVALIVALRRDAPPIPPASSTHTDPRANANAAPLPQPRDGTGTGAAGPAASAASATSTGEPGRASAPTASALRPTTPRPTRSSPAGSPRDAGSEYGSGPW